MRSTPTRREREPDPIVTVSVVVPVRDAARTLPYCLDALARLEPSPDEIVLVDNGSTDASTELLEDFAHRNDVPPVRVVTETRRGAAAARNAGTRSATGHIIAFTDADASPARGWLAHLTKPFSDASVGAVAGHVAPAPAGSTLELFSALYTLRLPLGASRHRQWSPRHGGFPTVNLAVRRELALQIGGFDEEVEIYGEDYDFCARLYEKGATIVYTPEASVTHHHRTTVYGLVRQAFGFGRGHAYMMRRHGAGMLWVDLPRHRLFKRNAPLSAWLDLASADKKLIALVAAGLFYSPLLWTLPLYVGYLILGSGKRARDTGTRLSVAARGELALLLLLKSAAMTTGRWWGSLRYRRICL